MDRRLFLLAALALSGCATAGPPRSLTPSPAPLAELEPLYAARAGREALVISVASNGCTTKDDFAFRLERRGEALTLAFARRRLDTCKAFAQGRAELTFGWDELGVPRGAPLFLLNPLVAWTGPGE
jgi:hypothetical protein